MADRDKITELESQIANLKARLPKHSVPPAMIVELEELEDALAALTQRVRLDTDPTVDLDSRDRSAPDRPSEG